MNTETAGTLGIDPSIFEGMGELVEVTTTKTDSGQETEK